MDNTDSLPNPLPNGEITPQSTAESAETNPSLEPTSSPKVNTDDLPVSRPNTLTRSAGRKASRYAIDLASLSTEATVVQSEVKPIDPIVSSMSSIPSLEKAARLLSISENTEFDSSSEILINQGPSPSIETNQIMPEANGFKSDGSPLPTTASEHSSANHASQNVENESAQSNPIAVKTEQSPPTNPNPSETIEDTNTKGPSRSTSPSSTAASSSLTIDTEPYRPKGESVPTPREARDNFERAIRKMKDPPTSPRPVVDKTPVRKFPKVQTTAVMMTISPLRSTPTSVSSASPASSASSAQSTPVHTPGIAPIPAPTLQQAMAVTHGNPLTPNTTIHALGFRGVPVQPPTSAVNTTMSVIPLMPNIPTAPVPLTHAPAPAKPAPATPVWGRSDRGKPSASSTINAIDNLGLKWDRVAVKKSLIFCQAIIRGWLARRKFKKRKADARYRKNIMNEIVTTEGTYIDNLSLMMKVYYQPLSEPGSYLSKDEIEAIFSRNIHIIINLHKNIHKQLKDRWQTWHYSSTVGDIFNYVCPFLKCHSEYVNQYEKSITFLSAAQRRTPVKNFMKKVRDQGFMDLPSYLIMPVQRVPRYELLLREMLKFTPAIHPDYPLVDKALQQVREVATLINEKNREAESLNKMMEIQHSHPNIVILAAHRRCIRYGEFETASKGTFTTKVYRVTLHLCNDVMIFSFPKGFAQDDVVLIPLDHSHVKPTGQTDSGSGEFRQLAFHSQEIATVLEPSKGTLILEPKDGVVEWLDAINNTTRAWLDSQYKQKTLHDCETYVDPKGQTPAHYAAMSGNVDILEHLFYRGIAPNILNSVGQTPLHLAIRKNSSPCVVLCVEHGAYVNLPDRNGKTPIMHALEVKNDKIILYLGEHGARLPNKTYIPDELRSYLEKALRTSAEIFARSNYVNYAGIRKSVNVVGIMDTHKKHVRAIIDARRGKNDPTCFLCAVDPRLMKFFCTQCQALCCQKCSFKRIPTSDPHKFSGQVCDSCFTIMTKHEVGGLPN